MNIEEYIASGKLEAYWAGELNEQEMLEVDRNAAIYPEIKLELEEIRLALDQYGQNAKGGLNQSILEAALDEVNEAEKDSFLKAVLDDGHEIPKTRLPFWSIAASILLIISAGFNVLLYQQAATAKDKAQKLEADVNELSQESTLLAKINNEKQLELDYAALRIAHFLSKDNIHVRMDGLGLSPDSYANVFWNVKSNAVFISVDNLPEPPHGHQYQLWAIKPGQAPIDAGIFDHSLLIQELKIIKGNVEAFAVTLEKEGGSPIATVDKTYVKGFLKKS